MRQYFYVITSISLLTMLVYLTGCAEKMGADRNDAQWKNLKPVANTNRSAAQPTRVNPYAVAMTDDGTTALVTLRGSELQPQATVAVIDLASARVRARLSVGSRPSAVRIRPGGDFAVVLSEFSEFAAVIDLNKGAVSGKIAVGYYAQELAFSNDGNKMYLSNRAEDTVQEWDLTVQEQSLQGELVRSAAAGTNPGALGLSPDGSKLYATDAGGLGLRVYDLASFQQVSFIFLNAPVSDIKPMGIWMVATTLNDTNGLPCVDQADFPVDDPSDGIFATVADRTCAVGFADIQNEIAFIDPGTETVAIRYTSDTAQASEADEVDHPVTLMQVKGALPQRLAVVQSSLAYVTMSASDQLVEMSLDASNPPLMTMGQSWDTGFTPHGVAINTAGTVALVANKLGETATLINLSSGETSHIVLNPGSPAFPATSAEIGELYFNSAKFATDGDQSCSHCHPDGGTDGKSWGVGVVLEYGRRATLPVRNIADTLPLLVEGVFNEKDFGLEMKAISFRTDFHDTSYTIQVQRRDEFYRKVSFDMFGQEVGFDAMIGHVGDFLMVEPRLLPNPFDKTTPEVERGEALFLRPDVGCALCHPAPSFASPENFVGVVSFAKYDNPGEIDPNTSLKFLENAKAGFFNANSLRGLWDRPGVLFHDGRASTVRETLLTPQHSCLAEGERAFNESGGQVDTNGGISHLTCNQIDDLVSYLLTIE